MLNNKNSKSGYLTVDWILIGQTKSFNETKIHIYKFLGRNSVTYGAEVQN